MFVCVCIRLGGGTEDYVHVKDHAFFATINFDDLMAKRVSTCTEYTISWEYCRGYAKGSVLYGMVMNSYYLCSD